MILDGKEILPPKPKEEDKKQKGKTPFEGQGRSLKD
jgi:hypothetical protein